MGRSRRQAADRSGVAIQLLQFDFDECVEHRRLRAGGEAARRQDATIMREPLIEQFLRPRIGRSNDPSVDIGRLFVAEGRADLVPILDGDDTCVDHV